MTCSFVVPGGALMAPPMTPEKMRSVARPRIFGPTELNVDADDGQHEHDDHLGPVRPEPAEQALGRRAEVQRLLPRLADLHVWRPAPSGRAASSLCGLLLRGLDSLGHQAASSALRWDSTISR